MMMIFHTGGRYQVPPTSMEGRNRKGNRTLRNPRSSWERWERQFGGFNARERFRRICRLPIWDGWRGNSFSHGDVSASISPLLHHPSFTETPLQLRSKYRKLLRTALERAKEQRHRCYRNYNSTIWGRLP